MISWVWFFLFSCIAVSHGAVVVEEEIIEEHGTNDKLEDDFDDSIDDYDEDLEDEDESDDYDGEEEEDDTVDEPKKSAAEVEIEITHMLKDQPEILEKIKAAMDKNEGG